MQDLTTYSYRKNLSNTLHAIDQAISDAQYIEAAYSIDTTEHRTRLIIARSAIEDIFVESEAMV